MMKVIVLGYGRSGKAAEALLKDLGYEVEVRQEAEELIRMAEPLRRQDDISFAVVSPGIPLTHPWFAECAARGIPVKSELQFGCEELKRRGWKLLAVTGSKGKSSVVKIVADAIKRAGGYAVACGNYGVPVSEVAIESVNNLGRHGKKAASHWTAEPSCPHAPWAIVEVSSFMMETTTLPADFFETAAILNLQEDHLDRHGSVAVYHALKRKLLTFTKKAVDASDVRGNNAASPLMETFRTDEPSRLLSGSYFDNDILRTNGLVAARLMQVAGLDEAAIRAAFTSFEPLPHRMNLVLEADGVRYVDDSKATSLAALAAGIVMTPTPVRLIAGGLPKGDDPASVLPTLTSKVRKVYLIGQSAELFRAAWTASVDCEVCGTMDLAVESAMRDAVSGETVLLSPGTASYDQFKSFGERGDVFASLVKKGKEKK